MVVPHTEHHGWRTFRLGGESLPGGAVAALAGGAARASARRVGVPLAGRAATTASMQRATGWADGGERHSSPQPLDTPPRVWARCSCGSGCGRFGSSNVFSSTPAASASIRSVSWAKPIGSVVPYAPGRAIAAVISCSPPRRGQSMRGVSRPESAAERPPRDAAADPARGTRRGLPADRTR